MRLSSASFAKQLNSQVTYIWQQPLIDSAIGQRLSSIQISFLCFFLPLSFVAKLQLSGQLNLIRNLKISVEFNDHAS